jgi:hypothetical protein
MMIHSGFQSFEFQQAFEMPKPLNFASEQDALKWLKSLWSQRPDLILRFREYLDRYSGDQEGSRLTDNQTIERLAVLLHSRRILVIARQTRSGSGQPTERPETLPPPFPLSERKRSVAAASSSGNTAKTAKTWISIELKDAAGKPVAREKYVIVLPDGTKVEGVLDSMGMAGVSGIDPGQCKVSFPRLDGSEWALVGNRAG